MDDKIDDGWLNESDSTYNKIDLIRFDRHVFAGLVTVILALWMRRIAILRD